MLVIVPKKYTKDIEYFFGDNENITLTKKQAGNRAVNYELLGDMGSIDYMINHLSTQLSFTIEFVEGYGIIMKITKSPLVRKR